MHVNIELIIVHWHYKMFQLIYLATALKASCAVIEGKCACNLDARIDDAQNSRSEFKNLYDD